MCHDYDIDCIHILGNFFYKLNVQQYEYLSHVIKCILVFFMGKVKLNEELVFCLINDQFISIKT